MMPLTCSIDLLYWNYAEQFACSLSLRPASRDQIRDRAVRQRPSGHRQKHPEGHKQRQTQSNKLPSYLQSLHHIRPARPSMVSQELGSDVSGKTQNTWKPPDQSSLHDICRTGIRPKSMQTCISSEDILYRRSNHPSIRCKAPRRSFGGPSGAQRPKAATASGQNNGGAERDRTADPLLAKQVLSQLSYSPISSIARTRVQVRQVSAPAIPVNSQSNICKCKWWAREDLNFRPHAYQACALTN
jgi:hypothetical protein